MSGSNDFVEPCSVISRLTTLGFRPSNVIMRHDSKIIRYDFLNRLKDGGLLPNRRELDGRLPPVVVESLDGFLPERSPDLPGKTASQEAIADLLGVYRDGEEVIVYDLMCEIVAVCLCIDAVSLRRIVAAHEVAHAVTHLGTDSREEIWESFGQARREDKELFAQIYSLFCFREVGDKTAIAVFHELSNHQHEIYNSWRQYEDSEVEEVNTILFERRLEIFPPINPAESLGPEEPSPETELGRLQDEIDVIEEEIMKYREAKRDLSTDPVDVAAEIGLEKEYRVLLKKRDCLFWEDEAEEKRKRNHDTREED